MNKTFRRTMLSFLTISYPSLICMTQIDVRKVADLSVSQLQEMIRETVVSILAFVDPYFILSQLEEVKDAERKLKGDLEMKEKQLLDIQSKIKQKEEELRTKASALSPDARERYQADIMSLRAQGQTKLEGLQAFMQQAQQELEVRFMKKIQEAADEIAQEMGIILVHGSGVVSAAKALDISSKVAERLNKKYSDEKKKAMKPAVATAPKPAAITE